MPQHSSSQISPGKFQITNVTPANLQNYRPQHSTSQNLCFIPSPSSTTTTISRIMATPPIVVSSQQTSTPVSKSNPRKRKEETPSTNINYFKDYLCYECGEFFPDDAQFEEHKSYHSFTRIALRMHVEQQRKDVEAPEFYMPLNGEEEKEYIKLRTEQVGRKKETAMEFHNTALNPGLHQNHNFAINSTLLDKRPAVKVFNIRSGTRIVSDRLEPESKMRKCFYTGDIDNPVGLDETLSMKEYMQKRLAEAQKKPIAFKPGEVITLDD
uniref:C2H2-type domain-containing protein n=1 Tax=Panagrolaimus sp. ES5 TaxID=591445 RepID=A0AC34F4L9_9BILA